MTEEKTRLTISMGDRVFERNIETEPEMQDSDIWGMSSPIPGAIILGTWEIYHLQKIALAATEGGHYQIFRSPDGVKFEMVHDHDTEIFNIFYIDEGVAVFSATDGWWVTVDTGLSWHPLDPGAAAFPRARSVAVLPYDEGEWVIFAYGNDKKVYVRDFPAGVWEEVYDSSELWTGKWWPAIAGGIAGVLLGVGPYLVRTDDLGDSFQSIQDFSPRVIESIVVSSQSNMPVYLIKTDHDGKHEMWWSWDVGDSVKLDETRFDVIEDAQTVVPTGTDSEMPFFVVSGRRAAVGRREYKIVRPE